MTICFRRILAVGQWFEAHHLPTVSVSLVLLDRCPAHPRQSSGACLQDPTSGHFVPLRWAANDRWCHGTNARPFCHMAGGVPGPNTYHGDAQTVAATRHETAPAPSRSARTIRATISLKGTRGRHSSTPAALVGSPSECEMSLGRLRRASQSTWSRQ